MDELWLICNDAKKNTIEHRTQIKILVEPAYDKEFKKHICEKRNDIEPYSTVYDSLHYTTNYFDRLEVTSTKREYEIIERDKNESKN